MGAKQVDFHSVNAEHDKALCSISQQDIAAAIDQIDQAINELLQLKDKFKEACTLTVTKGGQVL